MPVEARAPVQGRQHADIVDVRGSDRWGDRIIVDVPVHAAHGDARELGDIEQLHDLRREFLSRGWISCSRLREPHDFQGYGQQRQAGRHHW